MSEDKRAKPRRGIQSVEVGSALLKVLAEADGPLSLTDLSRRAGLPAAKAHPYLVSYGHIGLVAQEPTSGHYDFGPLALSMGLAALRRLNPLQIAISGLAELVAQTGLTAAVAVWGNHGPTVVHIHESDRPVHVNLRPGSVMSLINTATGMVFAAYMPPVHVAAALRREGLADSPTIGAGGKPQAELAATSAIVRERRMARTINHPIPGISSLSAPAFNHDGTLALAITLLGPDGTFDVGWDGKHAGILRAYAQGVSRRLGG